MFNIFKETRRKMAIYCPSCGRTIPNDANICPYCSKPIDRSQAIQTQQQMYPPRQQKDNTKLIIAIVAIILIVVIIIPIIIAATTYLYVSGELDGPEGMTHTPSISLIAQPGSGTSSNDVTITCGTITDPDISWYSVTFTLVDATDSQQLVEYTDYRITNSLYGDINGGDIIQITGLNNELQDGHEYRFTLSYDITGGTMGTVTWTQ
jgi:predicted nucleic acid-binding Zn ribbon protein